MIRASLISDTNKKSLKIKLILEKKSPKTKILNKISEKMVAKRAKQSK